MFFGEKILNIDKLEALNIEASNFNYKKNKFTLKIGCYSEYVANLFKRYQSSLFLAN